MGGTGICGLCKLFSTFYIRFVSCRSIPFRFVSLLFYFITPKPNKRIKQNKSFSTFCIVPPLWPPFCRLHCVWHPNGIVSRPHRLLTKRLGMVSLSPSHTLFMSVCRWVANGTTPSALPAIPSKLFAAKLLTKYLFAYFKSHFGAIQQEE